MKFNRANFIIGILFCIIAPPILTKGMSNWNSLLFCFLFSLLMSIVFPPLSIKDEK